jgi:hypothetical protein
MDRFASDKKHKKESYVLVLVEASGQVRLKEIGRRAGSLLRCRQAVEAIVASRRGELAAHKCVAAGRIPL